MTPETAIKIYRYPPVAPATRQSEAELKALLALLHRREPCGGVYTSEGGAQGETIGLLRCACGKVLPYERPQSSQSAVSQ